MLRQHSINSLWILLTRIITQGLSIVFIAIVARNLGSGVFGQFTVLASIVYLGNIFSTYGTDALLIRDIAREGTVTPLVSAVLWVQIGLSILWCLVAFLVGVQVTESIHLRMALLLFNLSLFPQAMFSVVSSILRGMERLELYLGLNLANALLQVFGALFFIRSSGDLLILCLWLTVTQMATAALGWLLCKAYIPTFSLKIRLILRDVLGVFMSAWRLALFRPVGLLNQRLNLFMLSVFMGDTATGWFSAAARIVEGLKLGHFALLNGLMPEMSRTETVQRQRVLRSSLFGLLLWSFVPMIFIVAYADPVIRIIYGQAFGPAVQIIRIVVWSLIPYTFSSYLSMTLSMRGAEAVVLNANLICLMAAIPIYLYLITVYGLPGVAWGTIAVEMLLAVLLLVNRRSLNLWIPNVN